MSLSNHMPAGLVGGIAGAVTVNLLHEVTRQVLPTAPRVDVVGMRAVAKISQSLGLEPPRRLRATTLLADLVANTLYYSSVAAVTSGKGVPVGAVLGAAAGIGGVLLPPRMHLGDAEVNRTRTTQLLTVGMYLAGGLVAGAIYSALTRQR